MAVRICREAIIRKASRWLTPDRRDKCARPVTTWRGTLADCEPLQLCMEKISYESKIVSMVLNKTME
nr:hypothetical protein [Escherichia coli]